jgi:hypothetical protein
LYWRTLERLKPLVAGKPPFVAARIFATTLV